MSGKKFLKGADAIRKYLDRPDMRSSQLKPLTSQTTMSEDSTIDKNDLTQGSQNPVQNSDNMTLDSVPTQKIVSIKIPNKLYIKYCYTYVEKSQRKVG